jgi:competence ComEA-like helix-hairpin-helix protein
MSIMKKLFAVVLCSCLALPVFAAEGKVNINKADAHTLMTKLDGVSQTLADRIVSQRKKEGIYIAPYDLLYVKGINRDFFKKNYDRITVGKVNLGMKNHDPFDPKA